MVTTNQHHQHHHHFLHHHHDVARVRPAPPKRTPTAVACKHSLELHPEPTHLDSDMPSTSTFRQTRPISTHQIAQSTLAVLRDHERLMHCQPLAGHVEMLSSPPERAATNERTPDYAWFRQTEYIRMGPFGMWKKRVVFENWFRDLEGVSPGSGRGMRGGGGNGWTYSHVSSGGGVESKVYAPDLTIRSTFRVERRDLNGMKRKRKSMVAAKGGDAWDEQGEGEGEWQLVEETEMVCRNALVKWMSAGQHRRARRKMLDGILREAEKRASFDGHIT